MFSVQDDRCKSGPSEKQHHWEAHMCMGDTWGAITKVNTDNQTSQYTYKRSYDELSFTVSPRTCDILPKSVMEFRVNFRPHLDNSFYGTQLECYVYFKSMRSFRLVNEDTFTPPFCTTLMLSG
jgi:hypothetical protein